MKRFAMFVLFGLCGIGWAVRPAVAGDVHVRIGINLGGCYSSRVCSPCHPRVHYRPYCCVPEYGWGYQYVQSPPYYIHTRRCDPLGFQFGLRTLNDAWTTHVYTPDVGRRDWRAGTIRREDWASPRDTAQRQFEYKARDVKRAWNDYKYDPRQRRNGAENHGQSTWASPGNDSKFSASSNASENAPRCSRKKNGKIRSKRNRSSGRRVHSRRVKTRSHR